LILVTNNSDEVAGSSPGGGFGKRLIVLGLVAAVIAGGYYFLSDYLSMEALADQEQRLRNLQHEYPVLAYGIAFLIYVAVTGLSLPGATVLTLAYSWFFGLARGIVLVSFASTTGATLAFLLSRYLFRDAVQRRFGDRLVRFNDALDRDGAFYLFTLRLIPVVPFFVINAVMGLTPIRTVTYWWVSQLGMLPGTVVYVYAGSSVPSLQTLADDGIGAVLSPEQLGRLLVAFALLGLFPLVVRWTLRYFGVAAPVGQSKTPGGETTRT
jgi:uncharacterized membrane protein YdjX (TVP38/TMEM64 family)